MEVIKVLGKVSPSATTLTTLYTVPTDKGAVISSLNICNRDTYDATIRIAIYRTESPASADYLEYNMMVYGNCSAQRLKGVTMAQGDIVSIYASSEHISFQLFGSEFDQTFEYP
jgi:hypothetical protein